NPAHSEAAHHDRGAVGNVRDRRVGAWEDLVHSISGFAEKWLLLLKPSARLPQFFSQLEGLLELALQFTVAQVVLHILELGDERVERGLNILEVGQADVAPDRVRTLRQARHVAKSRCGKFQREEDVGALL